MEGIKHDKNKNAWDLLPFDALSDVLKVLDYGQKTYGKNNWQQIENADKRLWSAAMRHLIAAQNDKNAIDSETGLSHLAHCATNLIFLLWYSKKSGANAGNSNGVEPININRIRPPKCPKCSDWSLIIDKNTNAYKCGDCGSNFNFCPICLMSARNLHMRNHDVDVEEYRCDNCDRSFYSQVLLYCDDCKNTILNKYPNHVADEDFSEKCSVCEKRNCHKTKALKTVCFCCGKSKCDENHCMAEYTQRNDGINKNNANANT